ncbi:hypothetical protein ACLMAL_27495 [Nocardia sp. CWNU-33]|uniref:hypothetical protein n=1 Tax=Nocardia sp. CWNU-33 TaxID=3392117 RepID=UPI00398ED9E4
MNNPSRFAVVGATGRAGRELVEALRREGHEVVEIARSDRTPRRIDVVIDMSSAAAELSASRLGLQETVAPSDTERELLPHCLDGAFADWLAANSSRHTECTDRTPSSAHRAAAAPPRR